MQNTTPSIKSSSDNEKKISDFLSNIEKSKPLLTASSVALAPSIFLFFVAMSFPIYSIAKVLELADRSTVKYPGQLNSYVKNQSQFAGGITGVVEYFAGMGVDKFKDLAGVVAEFIPAGDRSYMEPEKIEELYNGILRFERNKMVPAQEVKPFSVTKAMASPQGIQTATPLHV
jgi:hypothetical protein